MSLDVDHYAKLNLKYNPFSYLNNQELFQVTEERIDLEGLTNSIKGKNSFFIEFYGKKGRGKSTLAQTLYAKYLPEASFFQLKKKEQCYINKTSGILIIDSFQLLSLKNRLTLLNTQKRLIICSHYSHKTLSFLKRDFNHRVNFNKLKIDAVFIQEFVEKRIKLACLNENKSLPIIEVAYLKKLLNVYKNDLRSIQLSLYDFFIDPKKELYEL